MTTAPKVSIVAFHGTSAEFDMFSMESIGRGTETEPNNRLGVYLTPSPAIALDYAQSSCFADEEKSKVLAVIFEGRLGPAFFSPIDDFVSGELHRMGDGHVISRAFACEYARALKAAEDGNAVALDVCEIFSNLQVSMSKQFDALWVENGETPNLVVLNPSSLRIVQVLNEKEAEILEKIIFDEDTTPFGEEGAVQKSLDLLARVSFPLEEPNREVMASY